MKVIIHNNGILTPRELETIKWVALGKSNYDISRILSLSEQTIANRISLIFKKLDAVNRAHCIAKAIFKGVISIHMIIVAMIVNVPEDIDQKRGERRLVRRRNVIQAIYYQRLLVNPYHIPEPSYQVNSSYGENTV